MLTEHMSIMSICQIESMARFLPIRFPPHPSPIFIRWRYQTARETEEAGKPYDLAPALKDSFVQTSRERMAHETSLSG
jgi:hypothetical protein